MAEREPVVRFDQDHSVGCDDADVERTAGRKVPAHLVDDYLHPPTEAGSFTRVAVVVPDPPEDLSVPKEDPVLADDLDHVGAPDWGG